PRFFVLLPCQLEGRGFKSRFPLQSIQQVAHAVVSPPLKIVRVLSVFVRLTIVAREHGAMSTTEGLRDPDRQRRDTRLKKAMRLFFEQRNQVGGRRLPRS